MGAVASTCLRTQHHLTSSCSVISSAEEKNHSEALAGYYFFRLSITTQNRQSKIIMLSRHVYSSLARNVRNSGRTINFQRNTVTAKVTNNYFSTTCARKETFTVQDEELSRLIRLTHLRRHVTSALVNLT